MWRAEPIERVVTVSGRSSVLTVLTTNDATTSSAAVGDAKNDRFHRLTMSPVLTFLLMPSGRGTTFLIANTDVRHWF